MKNNLHNYLNINNFNIILISLIIITYPFNIKLFLFLRIADLLSIIFILLNLTNVKYYELKIISLIVISLIISSIVGLYNQPYNKINLNKLVYVYKFITPLFFYFIISKKNFDFRILKIFYRLLLLSYFILLFYSPFIDLFEVVPEKINNYHFPFTFFNTNKGDKHVLGGTLSFLTFFIVLYNNLKFKNTNLKFNKFTILIIFFSFLCGLYISSITLFLSSLVCLIYIFISEAKYFFIKKKKYKYFFISFIFMLFLSILIVAFFFNKYDENIQILINYPAIEIARFNNLFYNFPKNLALLLFGSGITTSPLFIDQGLLTLIHSFGLLPSIIFLYLFFNSNNFLKNNIDVKFFVLIIVISNLYITEFFLLSRYMLPLIIFYIVYIQSEPFFSKTVLSTKIKK